MRAPKIGVVVLNWNDAEATVNAVKSAMKSLQLAQIEHGIAIVDNGSEAAQRNLLVEKVAEIAGVKTHLNPNNQGYGAGMNSGVQALLEEIEYDYYWFLNNDLTIDADCASQLFEYILGNPNKKVIGPTIINEDGSVQCAGGCKYLSWVGKDVPHRPVIQLQDMSGETEHFDYIYGAAPLVSSNFFNEVGGYEPSYFLYFEELELAKRCDRNELGWCPKAVVIHRGGGTRTQSKLVSMFCAYHAALSCFRFTLKHNKFKLPTVIAARILGKLLQSPVKRNVFEFVAVSVALVDFVLGEQKTKPSQLPFFKT